MQFDVMGNGGSGVESGRGREKEYQSPVTI